LTDTHCHGHAAPNIDARTHRDADTYANGNANEYPDRDTQPYRNANQDTNVEAAE
jgi:hypothetical protein